MECIEREATVLEELVCASKGELRIHCHAVSGRGWVEVAGRRLVSKSYLQGARHLHAQNKLQLKHSSENVSTYELGNHVCSKVLPR